MRESGIEHEALLPDSAPAMIETFPEDSDRLQRIVVAGAGLVGLVAGIWAVNKFGGVDILEPVVRETYRSIG